MDVFGKSLMDYWKGDHKTKGFILRDDGLKLQNNVKNYFKKYTNFLDIEKKVLKYSKGKILDIGCGAGRHVLYLQKKGFIATGIDTSKLAKSVCKQRGCENCKVIDIFKNKFKLNSFDTILLMGTNIGFGGTLNRTIKLLKICNKISKKDGLIILTTKDVTKRKQKKQIKYNKKNIREGRYVGERKLRFEYKGQKSKWFKWIHIDPETLKSISIKSGWKIKCVFKSNKDIYSAVLIKSA